MQSMYLTLAMGNRTPSLHTPRAVLYRLLLSRLLGYGNGSASLIEGSTFPNAVRAKRETWLNLSPQPPNCAPHARNDT